MNRQDPSGSARLNQAVGRYASPLGLLLALLAAAAELISGFGSRLEWWHYRTGLALLGAAGITGGIAAAISLIGGVFSGRNRSAYYMAVAGIVIGLITAGIPWSWSRIGQNVPKIHDITTDTDNPPRFIDVIPLRENAENSADYAGQYVSEQQRRAYPDIEPLALPLKADKAFDRALKAAREMGWKIASSVPAEGRIEATATTFWFGFKDDVVVRVSPLSKGSRIDVRSLSRVGKGDVGTNAKRIRAYLKKLKKEA